MRTSLRVIHVHRVPALAERLGVLATVEVLEGAMSAVTPGEFVDPVSGSRWQLTSVAHSDSPGTMTLAVGLMPLTGNEELRAGVTLRQTADAAS